MNFGSLRPTVMNRDLYENVLGCFFGVFNKYIEVTILVKNARVDEFVFEFLATARAICCNNLVVRESSLRILVKILHVGMRRRAVEVIIILFHIFPVVAFAVGQTKQTLLKNGIFSIPKRQCEAEPLLII